MTRHIFNLRLSATYESSENDVATLEVQALSEDGWEPLDLNITTPGFLVYVYSLFTCQHLFLRTNSTERDLVLASSRGEILVETSEDWHLENVDVKFDVNLVSGDAKEDNIDYIISRMKQCPVSKNLPSNFHARTYIAFHHE
ncbi:MAG: hypothetical protein HKP12_00820 [Gammaproteobacteria bacterium]|nr:hypothetical protein [Gammaproteobacteria bacterium]NNJ95686.1 hypothetical protein [Gammaproteobacteria bacterium]